MEIAARPSPVQPPLVLAAAQGGQERRRQREGLWKAGADPTKSEGAISGLFLARSIGYPTK
uniref:Uncharacterized protein n=1 Tax=Oryza glumipatula TaxID=40148 RepID=A0A0D9Z0W6_9ORYZ